jgi:oligopeptide/dipeptide ABC transporter ATP-binding protein
VSDNLLRITGLRLQLPVVGQLRTILQGVNLSIAPGEPVGLVGESGSGKSMTARTVMRLHKRGAVIEGSVEFDGRPVLDMGPAELRAYRGSDVSMIYQDPRAHTNPLRKIGDFVTEGMVEHGVARAEAEDRAVEVLAAVGIPDGRRRFRQYPGQLSGGLLQRVMIAAALAAEPRLLLADEPTTALDVTTQQEVMAILDEQRHDRSLAMMFITHDLDLAAAVTDRIAVMYAGVVLEVRASADIHRLALHPYTVGLLAARPRIGVRGRLQTIPGRPVSAMETGPGCVFASRCRFVTDRCLVERPHLRRLGDGEVACHRAEELAGRIESLGAAQR